MELGVGLLQEGGDDVGALRAAGGVAGGDCGVPRDLFPFPRSRDFRPGFSLRPLLEFALRCGLI